MVGKKNSGSAVFSAIPTNGTSEQDAISTGDKGKKPLPKPSWFRLAVIILFSLFYVWDLFDAVSNLFGKLDELGQRNEARALNGYAPIDTPWALLIVNLALPVLVFGFALLLARKRNMGTLVIVLTAGLGVVAALSLSLTAFVLRVA